MLKKCKLSDLKFKYILIWMNQRLILLLILLLLKPAAQAKVGKTKLFIIAFATRKTPMPQKTEKHNLGK